MKEELFIDNRPVPAGMPMARGLRLGATMLRSGLTPAQRAMLVDKLADAANLALGALVFGQAIGVRGSGTLMVAGLALWAVLLLVAGYVARKE